MPDRLIPSGGQAALLHAINRGGRTGSLGECATKVADGRALSRALKKTGAAMVIGCGATAGAATTAAQASAQALDVLCSQFFCMAELDVPSIAFIWSDDSI